MTGAVPGPGDAGAGGAGPGRALAGGATRATRGSARANIARQRRFWTRNASSWDRQAAESPGLTRVVERVVDESAPRSGERVVDLGCGSGQLALRIAPSVAEVVGVDVSPAMIALLEERARAGGLTNVVGRSEAIEQLAFEPESVDLVVSNYVLHHLRDEDKEAAVRKAAGWLRPGGRLVVGDMMFGRGGEARDRRIIAAKIVLMLRKGPAGWWRIAKNAGRFVFRVQERPIPMGAWVAMLERAGFVDVRAAPVVNEAAVVRGTKPARR